MNYKLLNSTDEISIYGTESLQEFSLQFLNYYKNNINDIKNKLSINTEIKLKIVITDNQNDVRFVYGISDFSGFFNDKGVFAYINLNGKKTKEQILKAIMHELVHHLYKYYVYGKEKERITWVDEGLAQLLSNQQEELNDSNKFREFLNDNLLLDIDLNKLNHNDKSFGKNNGYNLSFIAIKYLYDSNSYGDFISIIKNEKRLKEIGNTILQDAFEFYNINNKDMHIKV